MAEALFHHEAMRQKRRQVSLTGRETPTEEEAMLRAINRKVSKEEEEAQAQALAQLMGNDAPHFYPKRLQGQASEVLRYMIISYFTGDTQAFMCERLDATGSIPSEMAEQIAKEIAAQADLRHQHFRQSIFDFSAAEGDDVDDVDAWVEWLISSSDDHNTALNETVSLTVHGAAQTTHYDMVEVRSIEATLHSVPVRAAKLDGGRFEKSTTFRCADDLWGALRGKTMIEGEHLNVYVETRQVNVIIVDGRSLEERRTNPNQMKLSDIPTMLRDMLRDMYPVSYIITRNKWNVTWNVTCFETFADVQRTARDGDTVAIVVRARA